jgi:hypothetical protein
MDLSAHSQEQLDDLAASLFEELVKRKTRVTVLARLSNDALKNLGFSILDIFKTRYFASLPDDKLLWERAAGPVRSPGDGRGIAERDNGRIREEDNMHEPR